METGDNFEAAAPLPEPGPLPGRVAARSRGQIRPVDDKLDDLLRLAKGCLRRGSCPGDPRPRDFFAQLDAELEAKKASQAAGNQDDEELQRPPKVERSRNLPPADPDAPAPDSAALRKEIAELERVVYERRQDAQVLNRELSKEVLEHCNIREEAQSLENEVKRLSKELRLARGHASRHEHEFQELNQALDAAVLAGTTNASGTGTGGTGPAVKTSARRHGGGKGAPSGGSPKEPKASAPGDAAANNLLGSSNRSASVSSACESSARGQLVVAPPPARAVSAGVVDGRPSVPGQNEPLAVEELKNVLVPANSEQQPPASEAKIMGHLKSENEKLASVIDAVGELSTQLNSPRQHPASHEPGTRGRAQLRLPQAPKLKSFAYSSVLSQNTKAKNWKHYL